ncbi:MAG TPA: hypothetical protein PL010_04115 [Flavobacteriales bacterium]|jgi:hypothetical protein|nr:hypothetical protein [Flavobacteriales bacterium]HNE81927.1 hypothetical protein [Flavobacteriales bacterium]HNI03793.1 hypothetical protein [Flavobacteriales bacterium]HNK42907.1 hypothetical protein [Flavobacteriales bacterium]HNM71073.1 hypothetical protein [Flavobacteriales bacterium]
MRSHYHASDRRRSHVLLTRLDLVHAGIFMLFLLLAQYALI